MQILAILFLLNINLLFSENKSFNFSQGTYGRIPMTETLSNFNEFTMEFWYYETGGHGSDEMIVGTEFFSGSKYGIYSFIDGYWPYISDGENWLGIQYNGSNGNAGVSYNSFEWYHLAFSYDGVTFRFFINGNIVYEQEGNVYSFGSENEDLVINRHTWNGGASSRLSGQIDELRISNIARYTNDFIPQNYEFVSDENTMGLWHFNNDFYDYSGNGNYGIHNGTGFSENIPSFIEITYGCTDELAINYNEAADFDDGNCEYPDNGDYSLEFDGVDDQVNTSGGVFNIGNDFTISTWFSTKDSDKGYQTIFNTAPEIHHPGVALGYNWNGNQQLAFCVGNGNDNGWYGNPCLIFNEEEENLENNRWYHIVLKKEGTNYTLYVDNILNISIDIEESINLDYYVDIELGDVSTPISSEFLKGSLHDFKLWSRAITNNEIESIFENQFIDNYKLEVDYKFNAGSGNILYDHSGNQNHGEIFGATWTDNIILGCLDTLACNYNEEANEDDDSCDFSCIPNGDYSLSFDGLWDYVLINKIDDFQIYDGQEFTIECWINSNDNFANIITNRSLDTNEPPWYSINIGYDVMEPKEGIGYAWIYDDWGGNSNTYDTDILNDLNWHHVALVKNSETLSLFLDGNLILQDEENITESQNIASSSGHLQIGGWAGPGWNGPGGREVEFFNGNIDEVRISDISRYNSNFDPQHKFQSDSSTLALYHFDEGAGDIIIDYSGNGNHGSLHGDVNWSDLIYQENNQNDNSIENLEVIFEQVYPNIGSSFTNISYVGEGYLAIPGIWRQGSMANQVASLFDTNGVEIWHHKRDPGWDHGSFAWSFRNSDSDLLFAGTQNGQGTSYFNPVYVKYDLYGNEILYNFHGNNNEHGLNDIVKISDQLYIVTGPRYPSPPNFLASLDMNFNVNSMVFLDDYVDGWGQGKIINADNYFYLIGLDKNLVSNPLKITKYNYDLDLIWTQTHQELSNIIIDDICYNEGKIAIVGQNQINDQGFIFQLDSEGTLEWNLIIDSEETNYLRVDEIINYNSNYIVSTRYKAHEISDGFTKVLHLDNYGNILDEILLFDGQNFLTGGFEIYENKLYISGTLDLYLPALTKINLIFENDEFQNCCYDLNGDINCDEILDISDIILMIDIILDLMDYTVDQNYCADMNNDGITDISDLILLIDTILDL